MSGDEPLHKYDDPSLKGLSRYFNSSTIKGRANVAIATYAFLIGVYLFTKLTKSKHTECPAEFVMMRFGDKNRYGKWNRVMQYLDRYISSKHAENIKNASLTTISFLGGFFFYDKIVRNYLLEKDYPCHCPNPKEYKQKNIKVPAVIDEDNISSDVPSMSK